MKIEKEIDEILLDFCTKEKCKESCDHKILKKVVKERLMALFERLTTKVSTENNAKTITINL